MPATKRPRELTGRAVLVWLIAFFGVVFAVNGILVRAATSTFGGVEVQSSYKAGLMFETEVARARAQDDLHWRVDGHVVRDAAGEAVLDVSVRDAQGRPVSGIVAQARLAHPADERLDRHIDLRGSGAGKFRGQVQAHAGRWDLIIDVMRGEERVFRSRSAVTLN
jgi:nitrogen fixation protein FixH